MIQQLIKMFLVLALVVCFVSPNAYGQPAAQEETMTMGPRKQLATIIFCGLGGAILGLSTLSFYGRPQEKLSNIAVGFAFGIIGGTFYTAYRTATRPYEPYSSIIFEPALENDRFAMLQKTQWTPEISYEWSF